MEFDHHNELVAQICTRGDLESLARLFAERTREWPHFMRHVEGGSVGSFDDLESQIQPDVAFHLVPKAAQIALSQQSADLRDCPLVGGRFSSQIQHDRDSGRSGAAYHSVEAISGRLSPSQDAA